MEKRNGGLLLTTRVLRFPLDQLLHGSFVPADWVSIPCSISEVQFRGFERGCEARTPHHCIEPPVLPSEIAARIFEHALWMRKEGYRPSTIRGAVKNLKALSRHCNILNPESLKAYLASRIFPLPTWPLHGILLRSQLSSSYLLSYDDKRVLTKWSKIM